MTVRSRPLVSVIVPVFNRRALIGDALASLAAQTLQDIEIIVVDDGSEDGSAEAALASGDRRIKVIEHPRNRGIPAARNTGLAEARGLYIAWLDSDDLALPRRLERQVAFLDAHPELAMVGSCGGRRSLDGSRKRMTRVPVFTHEDIVAELLFRSPFQQSAIMGRADILTAFAYREEFPVCEDLDVFLRISREHRIANMAEVLIDRRLHRSQSVNTESALIRDRKRVLFREELNRLGVPVTDEDLDLHVTLGRNRGTAQDRIFVERSERWLQSLIRANERAGIYNRSSFAFIVGAIWAQACRAGSAWSGPAFASSLFARSPLSAGLFNKNARKWACTALPLATGLSTAVRMNVEDQNMKVAIPSRGTRTAPRTARRAPKSTFGGPMVASRSLRAIQTAFAIALVSVGWIARGTFEQRPLEPLSIATQADQARDMLVASLAESRTKVPADYKGIARQIGLPVPQLPSDWHIVSAASIPTGMGPGLAVSALTKSGVPVVLFAERTPRASMTEPVIRSGDDEFIATWTMKDASFALAGNTSRASLDRYARQVDRA